MCSNYRFWPHVRLPVFLGRCAPPPPAHRSFAASYSSPQKYKKINYCKSRSPHPQHEYGQAQILLGLLRRPVNVFLYLGTGPGSLPAETQSKELTPPSYNRVSFGQGLGREYTQCVQGSRLIFFQPVRPRVLMMLFIFIMNSAHEQAYRGRTCLPNRGKIPHWD